MSSNSQPPPSYGGQPNYAQWPPSFPGMMPPNFPTGQYSSPAPPAPPHLLNPNQPFPYPMGGIDPNAHAPAPPNVPIPTGPGLFYPPHFPFLPQFDPSQVPPHLFPPLPMPPPLDYSQLPAPGGPPPGSSQPPSQPAPGLWDPQAADASRAPHSRSQPQTRATSYTNSNFEEGEVSDEQSKPTSTTKSSIPANKSGLDQQSSAPQDDLEEGEAFSTRSSSRSRSSSPYNPPLSVSADPEVVNRAIEMQKREVTTTATSEESQPPKSLAQLRVQAQGALLSLAPHNIRYDELVAEGINPTVLKQLYEEVGIRVGTPKSEKKTATATVPPKPPSVPTSKPPTPSAKSSNSGEVAIPNNDKARSKPVSVPSPKTKTASPSSLEKPMERKEVIARMLAAKAAARASEPKAASKETPTIAATPTPSSATPTPAKPLVKANGVGAKEKNKAQTELARKRIEELRKQAILKREEKNQQLAQASPPTGLGQSQDLTASPGGPAAAVQHPLPVRPPPPSSDPTKIPGLLLAGSDQETPVASSPPAPPSIEVDPTPLSRPAQRKRPRASDFDEPVGLPKKPFSFSAAPSDTENRLIIDISEDESLYGDDEGADMDVDSSPENNLSAAPSLDVPKPPLSRNSSAGRVSTSTSQGHDSESLREKDLQIQAMHRRIAELELKRKEKLAASRTQSPRPLSDSSVLSSGQSSAGGVDSIAETTSLPVANSKVDSDVCVSGSALVDRPDLINTFSDSSIRVLASMDIGQLDNIRSKILRLKEIEAGLPQLDMEIESSEQRLTTCQQEAASLLAEITMGKEGRLQLVEELKKLSDEIDGLTLEDLDELRRQAEIKEQQLDPREVSPIAPASADVAIASNDHIAPLSSVAETTGDISEVNTNGAIQNDHMEIVQEAESPSQSESGGSSMDESSDGETSDDESSAPENLAASLSPNEEPALDAEADVELNTNHPYGEVSDQPLPLATPSVVADIGMADGEIQHPETEQSRRESSEESDDYEPPEDDYEPPEADTGAESPGSTYSPPLSPAPLAIFDGNADPAPPADQPPDEAFISAPPMPAWESRQLTEILGASGNEPTPAEMETKFTPYTSPLKMFEAYRFHPEYLENVSDGYRSLTYSHDIDSMKMICPYELAGGVCNDNTCGFQHFRDMTPSDDKILVQMGALREGQTEEEKETYRTGLKEIINGMRRDKVKDFSTVANEIAAYRRRVLQDPSRVLHL